MSDGDFGRRWVLVAEAADRPGALNAVSAVFASRGVNFESTSASVDTSSGVGHIVGVFRTGERRARLLLRTTERLEAVRSVEVRSAADPSVRAVVVVRSNDGEACAWRPGDEVAASWTGAGSAERPLLIEASLATVERLVEAATAAGLRAALGAVWLV